VNAGNMRVWDRVRQPPKEALKQISGGRLRGMTDISPQWRYEAATDVFGPCGIGWKWELVRVWREDAAAGQVFAFAEVLLYIHDKEWCETVTHGDEKPYWADPVPGIGGSMLIEQEKLGLHVSDEGYKMAVTDALSVAFKMLGFGADVYAGRWDGSKYAQDVAPVAPAAEDNPFGEGDTPSYPGIALPPTGTKGINDVRAMLGHAQNLGWDEAKVLAWVNERTGKKPSELTALVAAALLAAIKEVKP